MYDSFKYSSRRPNVGVTIVPFIFDNGELKVLVYKRNSDAEVFANYYALPNCFFDISIHQTLDDAARYAMQNKTNVSIPYIEQLQAFSGSYIDPERIITINNTYFALAQKSDVIELNNKKFETEWVSIDILLNKKLAFNHNEVLITAIERLKAKAEYTNIICYLLPEKFTISELKHLTEYLIDEKLDNSRFRDRISKTDIILEVEGEFKTGIQRPAQLYKINHNYNGFFYPKSLTKPK